MSKERNEKPTTPVGETGLNISWDDTHMRSSYANVCNVTGTREELVLLFGVHQAWKSGTKEITVQLQDRVILSPFAAKRLNMLLTRVLREFETRYGALKIEGTGGPPESLPNG